MAPGVMWTKEECDKLNELVYHHGKKWTPIASYLGGGRTGKQCRRQWERLNIVTKQCGWTPEEDAMLLEYHAQFGNKWTRISRIIGGRTDNAVKNRYHALRLKRRAAKYLTRIDSISPSGDVASTGRRCLKNSTSLDERRAAKEEVDQTKAPEGLYRTGDEKLEGGVCFKSEPVGTTGFYSNFEGCWNRGCIPLSGSAWAPETCKLSCSASMPYTFGVLPSAPETVTDGQQRTYHSLHQSVCPLVAPSLMSTGSSRAADEADSMESSSENKLDITSSNHMECLSSMCGGMPIISSPFFLGSGTDPVSSRVLDNMQQQQRGMTGIDGGVSQSMAGQKRNPGLTPLDLSFQQKDTFDFDALLRSVSPISPTYLKFLNSLSPIERQPSCVSDHESHMKA